MGTEYLEWCDGCNQSTCSMQLSLQWEFKAGFAPRDNGKRGITSLYVVSMY